MSRPEAVSPQLTVDDFLARLDEAVARLNADIPFTWRYPVEMLDEPLAAEPAADWPTWDNAKPGLLRKNEPNWFYAEVVFPEMHCGISLRGTEARIFVHGYCPFTLWLDGVELYKETHVWHATGPIADPWPVPVEPGKPHRMIACFEPTELPADYNPPGGIIIKSAAAHAIALELSAASAQLRIARGFADTEEERALLDRAAALIDTTALETDDWARAKASIAAMEEALLPFSERAKAMTVHLIGHTHIDMDWMWTWPDTVHCIRRDARAVTDIMTDYPEVCFTISQVPFYDVVREMDPDVFAKIKQFIAEGRWECAAGTWVEGDLNMADGESIARHMLYAKQWTREHLGTEAKVLWEPDTFGHPGNMPQLARLGEHDCYFHWRCNPGRNDNWPARIWVGVDDTPVVAYSNGYGGYLEPGNWLWNVLQCQKFGFTHALHIWGLGDHGGGLPRFQLAVLEQFRHKPLIPTFKFDTMAGLLQSTLAEKKKLPSNKGETFSLFEGCFTTHASIKQYNRRCETALLTAEALAALAGLDRNADLREAWTKMLFNHFHDIFDGAAVHDSYINAHARAEASLQAAGRVTREAMQALVIPGEASLLLMNPLGFTRSEPVRAALPERAVALQDATGRVIPVQRLGEEAVFIAEDVPAYSGKSYRILDTLPEGVSVMPVQVMEAGDYFRIETANATSQLHKGSGAIGSYFDKVLGKEFVAYGVDKTLTHVPCTRKDLALNVFQVLDEAHNRMTAWLINDILREESLLRGAEVTLAEAGQVFARFVVKHAFRSSVIEEDVIYYRDFPRVDFEARIDWREQGSPEVGVPQLKVSFGTTMIAPRARFEGPFFIPERPADGIEQPTQKWLDVTGYNFGFTLLNDSKYGVDVLGGRARLTLLRNAYNPDPESDSGHHVIRFAFVPHSPSLPIDAAVRMGMAYNRPPATALTNMPAADALPNLVIEGNGIVCTSLRRAEYSDKVLVRFFNTEDALSELTFTLGAGIAAAEEVNFHEHPTCGVLQLADGKLTATFGPYEVKTYLVDCTWNW